MYLIHFSGWSKIYDEWIDDNDPRLDQERIETFFSNQSELMRKPSPVPSERKRKAPSRTNSRRRVNPAKKTRSQEEVTRRRTKSEHEAPAPRKAKSHEDVPTRSLTPLEQGRLDKEKERERYLGMLDRQLKIDCEIPNHSLKKRSKNKD